MTTPTEYWPSVAVVIPAHQRPQELRRAIKTVGEQDYSGPLSVIVVFDRATPDKSLQAHMPVPVTVMANERTPGLAGARNTGILTAEADLVAFCDDDDYWEPGKLAAQVAAWRQDPDAVLCTTAIAVEYEGNSTPRYAATDRVTHQMLVRSRMSMLHSSTLLFRRQPLLGELGLVSEDIPGSQNEDWDLLLRASALHPIVHVDKPLVHVPWGRASYFSRRWDTKIASSLWIMEQHPEVADQPQAAARLMGQIAFAHACRGERRKAYSWTAQALRRDPTQWRAYVAGVVAVAPTLADVVLAVLHRFGRGV